MKNKRMSKEEVDDDGGFYLPGVPLRLYPTSDPNIVNVKMNDPAWKNCTAKHFYVTQPYKSEETLALMAHYNAKRKASSYKSKSQVLHGFGVPKKRPAQPVATQLESTGGTNNLHTGIVPYSDETKVSSHPDPCLCYIPLPYQVGSAPPPRKTYEEYKAADAAYKANLEASRAFRKARSAIAVAAAPREQAAVPRHSEPPSNMNASEAAAPTSTEGEAEAGGPVLKRARQDLNPSAADSTATGSRNN